MHINLQESEPAQEPKLNEFLDQRQLLKIIPVSARTITNWRRRGKIPWVSLGGRRVLYHWPTIREALLRAQRESERIAR